MIVLLIQLKTLGFRNLDPIELNFSEGSYLILGSNGAGKTSLIESIYMLATTRSFRTARVSDCIKHGEQEFRIFGEVEEKNRTHLEVTFEDGRCQRFLNGSRVSLSDYLSTLPVIAWTGSDIEILVGSPAERRRFLDRGILGQRPAALSKLRRYRRALEEKRRLLDRSASDEEWHTWNLVLAQSAAELISLRADYTKELSRHLKEVLLACRIGLPPIELRYQSSPRFGCDGTERIYEELSAVTESERRSHRLLLGPHRDDLKILWCGHEIRRVASAGERKALGLALVIAHGCILRNCGRNPTYLLDDIDTELDRTRLELLWKVIGRAQQIFATSNRPRVWESVEIAKCLYCDKGRVRKFVA